MRCRRASTAAPVSLPPLVGTQELAGGRIEDDAVRPLGQIADHLGSDAYPRVVVLRLDPDPVVRLRRFDRALHSEREVVVLRELLEMVRGLDVDADLMRGRRVAVDEVAVQLVGRTGIA